MAERSNTLSGFASFTLRWSTASGGVPARWCSCVRHSALPRRAPSERVARRYGMWVGAPARRFLLVLGRRAGSPRIWATYERTRSISLASWWRSAPIASSSRVTVDHLRSRSPLSTRDRYGASRPAFSATCACVSPAPTRRPRRARPSVAVAEVVISSRFATLAVRAYKCPRAVCAAGGVAPKGLASARRQRYQYKGRRFVAQSRFPRSLQRQEEPT